MLITYHLGGKVEEYTSEENFKIALKKKIEAHKRDHPADPKVIEMIRNSNIFLTTGAPQIFTTMADRILQEQEKEKQKKLQKKSARAHS
jgi:hypothetical protein